MAVGKKVILRAIPYWREVGTEKWIQDEEARYICPECGNKVFRGVVKCNQCGVEETVFCRPNKLESHLLHRQGDGPERFLHPP
jgi:predicted RNA-binding Zn-ribbon protein involved in translation (DUF1610 family)